MLGKFRQCLGSYQCRPQASQLTLIDFWKTMVQVRTNNEIQNRISQEL